MAVFDPLGAAAALRSELADELAMHDLDAAALEPELLAELCELAADELAGCPPARRPALREQLVEQWLEEHGDALR